MSFDIEQLKLDKLLEPVNMQTILGMCGKAAEDDEFFESVDPPDAGLIIKAMVEHEESLADVARDMKIDTNEFHWYLDGSVVRYVTTIHLPNRYRRRVMAAVGEIKKKIDADFDSLGGWDAVHDLHDVIKAREVAIFNLSNISTYLNEHRSLDGYVLKT